MRKPFLEMEEIIKAYIYIYLNVWKMQNRDITDDPRTHELFRIHGWTLEEYQKEAKNHPEQKAALEFKMLGIIKEMNEILDEAHARMSIEEDEDEQ
ncbi:hypothetical protein [Sapientia aquatica]|uniref:Uncharacterized protein n=1 Tax=Sapientia aquatica TaxID=1549640 RepID=A0A4R5VWE4_9BURK|nr:hypothetical protein [Sapientia aquatica]TDK63569.1 hypothetical protein E2I14_15320 [Sapientia aquatica]